MYFFWILQIFFFFTAGCTFMNEDLSFDKMINQKRTFWRLLTFSKPKFVSFSEDLAVGGKFCTWTFLLLLSMLPLLVSFALLLMLILLAGIHAGTTPNGPLFVLAFGSNIIPPPVIYKRNRIEKRDVNLHALVWTVLSRGVPFARFDGYIINGFYSAQWV